MQAHPEGAWVKPSYESLHVEFGLLQHPGGQVDHADLHPVALQVLTQERETDWVHLEYEAGGDKVRDRARDDEFLSEVIDARRV